jgi:hypothetical protein
MDGLRPAGRECIFMTTVAHQIKGVPSFESNWALLERIAASTHLKRAPRLQELLLYVGKCALKDGYDKISEQKIGVDVFGRHEGYDTSADNIVRTSVSELRKRIDAYFESEGRSETLVMEIPRWSYIPIFTRRLPEERIHSEHPVTEPAPAIEHVVHAPREVVQRAPINRFTLIFRIATALVIVLLAGSTFFFWNRYRELDRSLYPWKSQPSVAALWNDILSASPETDIVLADASFGMVQDISKKTFPFNDYLSRSYVSQLQNQDLSPDMHTALSRIISWDVVNPEEVGLAQRIQAFDPLGKSIRLYNARNYTPDLLTRDNVILIGGKESNPWDELFEGRMNFTTAFDGNPHIVNRAPAAGEQPVYNETDSVQYCVVAYLPNSNHNGTVMLMEGTNGEATEAAGDFLLSEDELSNFMKTLHVKELPYFEVLLRVSSVRGTPLTASIEAYREYSNLH